MFRSKIIFAITAVLTISAGLVVGRLSAVLPKPPPPPPQDPNWLGSQLGLNDQQRKAMDAIWADTHAKLDQTFAQRREADRQRDQAVSALFTPAQLSAYEKIQDAYRQKRADLDKQSQQLVHDAGSRSRALLNDQQKKLWDDSAKQHEHDRHGIHRGGPGGPRPDRPHPEGAHPDGPPPGESSPGDMPTTMHGMP